MAKKKATRKRYSDEQRSKILAAASEEGLTAAAVQKRFGVTPVTFYSWRKKAGTGKRRGRPRIARAGSGGLLESRLRSQLQTRMRKILPGLIESEVSTYLDAALGGRRRKK
jgi:transposase-like protein